MAKKNVSTKSGIKGNISIGGTIKKLVQAEQEKKFKEFEARLTELEEGIKHVLSYMKDNERTLQHIENKVNSGGDLAIPEPSTNIDKKVDSIKKELQKELSLSSMPAGNQYSEIKKILDRNNKIIEKTTQEITSLKKKLNELKGLEDVLSNTDVKSLTRNIEVLRTRSQWIEDRLEKFSITPLLEKIKELEIQVNSIKASSPLVME